MTYDGAYLVLNLHAWLDLSHSASSLNRNATSKHSPHWGTSLGHLLNQYDVCLVLKQQMSPLCYTVRGFTHDIPHAKQSLQPLHHRSVTF
jgi:hypothetical protein